LTTESNYMSFMLGKRLGFWLRLFVNSAGEEKPILVAVIPEVLTEIVDPLISFGDPVDKHSFEIFRTSLASISCLDNFDGAEFSEIIKSLRDSDALTSYWQSLAMVLTNPKDLSAIEKLNDEIEQLENLLADYAREEAAIGRRQSRLSLVSGSSLTIGDLWKRFDKSCCEITVSDAILDQPVLVILYGRESFH